MTHRAAYGALEAAYGELEETSLESWMRSSYWSIKVRYRGAVLGGAGGGGAATEESDELPSGRETEYAVGAKDQPPVDPSGAAESRKVT